METSLISPLRNFIWSSSTNPSFKVSFPKAPDMDLILIGAELYQDMQAHDRLVLHYKGTPYIEREALTSHDPVIFTVTTEAGTGLTWYGYINHVTQGHGLDGGNTDIVCVGASRSLKDTDQTIYTNLTSDQGVSKIAAKHGFSAICQRDPRVRDSVAQSGQSDWQLIKSLAKQSGFALYCSNTTIFYMSKDKIYNAKKDSAPYFIYVDSEEGGPVTPALRGLGSIISFSPEVSDNAPEIGVRVDRVVTGINKNTGLVIKTTHPYIKTPKASKGLVKPSAGYFLK